MLRTNIPPPFTGPAPSPGRQAWKRGCCLCWGVSWGLGVTDEALAMLTWTMVIIIKILDPYNHQNTF